MKINDAFFGLVLAILGGLVLFTVRSYPTIPGQQVGPALFPGLIATGILVCGLALIVRGWLARKAAPWAVPGEWMRSARHVAAFALLVASVLFYIFAAQALGFLPTAMLILWAMFYVLRVPPGKSLLIAVITTLAI
ncbi:MAG: tripartite tricarboxylate transporter TctB family protein, partial [Polaromonas sp.]|nr:tripartite tricarboxylate transporter TctB family protein [Polaromonas sp.]